VDKAPGATANHLDGLNKGGLVEKAKEAVAKMARQGRWHTTEVKVVGAKRLQNGGVVYKLNSQEASLWLGEDKVDFTKHFSESLVIKDKVVSVIVEHIPIAHNPDALGEHRKIE